jgi:hypothetical protein
VNQRNDRLNDVVAGLASVRDQDLASLLATPAARTLFEESSRLPGPNRLAWPLTAAVPDAGLLAWR